MTTHPLPPTLARLTRRDFVASTLLVAAAGPALGSRRSPDLPWTELRGGRALMTDPNAVPGGNCLAIVGDGAVFLVDAKFTWLGGMLAADAASLVDSPRLSLLNTHHHADHTGGNWALTKDHTVYAHPKARERVLNQHQRYLSEAAGVVRAAASSRLGDAAVQAAQATAEKIGSLPADAWAPTNTLDQRDNTIDFPGTTIHAHHFGAGHTDNDLVFHAPELNVIHTGDLVFNGLYPYCDQSAGVSIRGWIGSLRKIYEKCDTETVLVPGHGPSGDRSIVKKQIDFHEQLLEAVAADIEQGLSRDEATKRTYPFMEGLGFERIRPLCIGTAFDEISASR